LTGNESKISIHKNKIVRKIEGISNLRYLKNIWMGKKEKAEASRFLTSAVEEGYF
jgi:hypothetical protein